MELSLYQRACSLMNISPLGRQDCGRLCNKRCCKGDESDGMFLFPGEEDFYSQKSSWAEIREAIEPVTGQSLSFLVCRGTCPRELRPLACRTFPLLPKINAEGELELYLDKRGILICPLVKADNLNLFHPAFLRRVKRAWGLLLQDPELREFVHAFSRVWEETPIDPWEKIFKTRC